MSTSIADTSKAFTGAVAGQGEPGPGSAARTEPPSDAAARSAALPANRIARLRETRHAPADLRSARSSEAPSAASGSAIASASSESRAIRTGGGRASDSLAPNSHARAGYHAANATAAAGAPAPVALA